MAQVEQHEHMKVKVTPTDTAQRLRLADGPPFALTPAQVERAAFVDRYLAIDNYMLMANYVLDPQ